jgi:hypothetical protein
MLSLAVAWNLLGNIIQKVHSGDNLLEFKGKLFSLLHTFDELGNH